MRWMRGASVALVLVLAMGSVAVAQDVAEKPVTFTVTLSPEQVTALKAYREQVGRMRGPSGNFYLTTSPAVLIPPSTPFYDVVPKVKTPLEFAAWVEEQVAARLNQMIAEVEQRNTEELAAEVKALTPEQKRAIKVQIQALKEQK